MKHVITALDIGAARKMGRTSLSVPAGTLVTPQAADDARDYGITLLREGESVPQRGPRGGAKAAAPQAARPAVSPVPAVPAAPARDTAALEAEVRRLVAARLGPSADPAALDAAIRAVLSAGGAGQSTETPFVRRAGGLALVRREGLPKTGGSPRSGPEAVDMIEALPPDGGAPGVGYLRWENTSFTWTFSEAEVVTVLAGELTFSCEGASLSASPGDSFRIAAGATVTLAARGEACCVHSSWPPGK